MMIDDDPNAADNQPASAEYEVDYGKPPKHSRFKPGQSGNPKGRGHGVRNLRTDILEALRTPLTVTQDGKRRKISTQRGVILKLVEKSLKGDVRSLVKLLELAAVYNNDAPLPRANEPLAIDDQAIVDDFYLRAGDGGDAVVIAMSEAEPDGADGAASVEPPPAQPAALPSAPPEPPAPEVKADPRQDYPGFIVTGY